MSLGGPGDSLRRFRRRKDFGIILLSNQRFKLQNLNAGPKPIKSWPYLGKTYQTDAAHRFNLEGYWHPSQRTHFFSDLMSRDGIKRNITFWLDDGSHIPGTPIWPLDRLSEIGRDIEENDLTPQVHRSFYVSKLYHDRMRRLKIGGIDWRIVAIGGLIGGIILFLLYASGYLG